LTAGAGQKIVVASNALSVEVAGAPVSLDVKIRFSAIAPNTADIQAATHALIQTYLTGAGSTIGLTEIWQALAGAGHTPTSIEVTAEYSASGAAVTRTLSDGAAAAGPANLFKIAANEQPVLRSLDAAIA
jgi:hypothetical protein